MSLWLCERCCCLQEDLDIQLERLGGLGPTRGGGRRSTLIVAPRVRRGCGGALQRCTLVNLSDLLSQKWKGGKPLGMDQMVL